MDKGEDLRTDRLPVFVYGTLRVGEKNHPSYLRPHVDHVLRGTARGQLFFVDGEGYPYVLPGAGRVLGDLVFIRVEAYEKVLSSLDALEEYDSDNEAGSLYLRRETSVRTDSGDIRAWIYYWQGPRTGRKIPSGDFRKR